MEPVGAHRRPRGSFIATLRFLHPSLSKLGRTQEIRHNSHWRYDVFARLRSASAPIGHSPRFLLVLRYFCILRHGAHPAEDRRNCIRGVRRMEPVGAHRRPRGNFAVTVFTPLRQVKLSERCAHMEPVAAHRTPRRSFTVTALTPLRQTELRERGVRRMEPVGAHRRPRRSFLVIL